MIRATFVAATLALSASAVQATPMQDLVQALGLPKMVDIVRDEGLTYSIELAEETFGSVDRSWGQAVEQVYNADRMGDTLEEHFAKALENVDIAPLVTFFTTNPGKTIVELEMSAREAISDPFVEEAARESYLRIAEVPDPRMEAITEYIAINDLVEYNVVSALNSNIAFYRGMTDAGALQMSEDDILREAWSQEAETRADTEEWLYAFLLMAYGPLGDDDLELYTALSETRAGRALNAALFAGFNAMYDEISYGLGQAVALQMATEEL